LADRVIEPDWQIGRFFLGFVFNLDWPIGRLNLIDRSVDSFFVFNFVFICIRSEDWLIGRLVD
jgi:hypothetical protein